MATLGFTTTYLETTKREKHTKNKRGKKKQNKKNKNKTRWEIWIIIEHLEWGEHIFYYFRNSGARNNIFIFFFFSYLFFCVDVSLIERKYRLVTFAKIQRLVLLRRWWKHVEMCVCWGGRYRCWLPWCLESLFIIVMCLHFHFGERERNPTTEKKRREIKRIWVWILGWWTLASVPPFPTDTWEMK